MILSFNEKKALEKRQRELDEYEELVKTLDKQHHVKSEFKYGFAL
jgi:hypothetical protein